MTMFSLRILNRRTPVLARARIIPPQFRSYANARPGVPSNATGEEIRPPPKHAPNPGKPPKPTTDPGSSYWGDQAAAIPRSPPTPTKSDLLGQVESVEIACAPGVEISGHRRLLVACVLDLFGGQVTRQKLEFLTDDAVLENPLGKAVGKAEVESVWWTLDKLMQDVRLMKHHLVEAGDKRFVLEVEVKYTLKGLGKETVVESVVEVELDDEGQKIRRIVDKWGGEESKHSTIMDVSSCLFRPRD